VLPYRSALVAAKAAATVDQVSGGRFILGVGVGWDEAEFADLRRPFRERGRMSDDYLRAIQAAWASDVPEYSGPYVRFSGATFTPRPVQRPSPSIRVGGAPGIVSAPAVRRCALLGDAWDPLGLGPEWVTFDLPRAGLPAMVEAMGRLAREVGPAAE
jgi:alkanesulfonate monooxygenase SsuD/methylene tetrahydromethanopterin reductase-like flavin-dependent oxidoreductase (luciferase family)